MTTLLVTRPQPDADGLAAKLRDEKFSVLVDPFFTTEFAASPPAQERFQALLATSRNAIRALTRTAAVREFLNYPLFAIGEGTEEEAQRAGFFYVQSAEGANLSLAETIRKHCAPSNGPLLYLAGHVRKPELEAALNAHGFLLKVWEGYAMRPSKALRDETLAALHRKAIDAVLLFSEQASVHFLQLTQALETGLLAYPDYICLSKQVAMPLLQKGLSALAAPAPSLHAMIELLNAKYH